MRRSFAFAIVFALGLGVSVQGPNPLPAIDDALRRFSDMVQRGLTPLRAVEPGPIDARAAAKIDEDLDWSTAKTSDGLRVFLSKWPNGAHALEAQAKLDGLIPTPAPAQPPPLPRFSPVVEVENEPGPRTSDFFANLLSTTKQTEQREQAAEQTKIETVTRWRERVVTRWFRERPRYHYRRPAPWPFFAWFGPRAPGNERR